MFEILFLANSACLFSAFPSKFHFQGLSANAYSREIRWLSVRLCILGSIQRKIMESLFHFYYADLSNRINATNIYLISEERISHENKNKKPGVTGH